MGFLPTPKPMPAAFIVNMQFVRVMYKIHHCKIYKPKKSP